MAKAKAKAKAAKGSVSTKDSNGRLQLVVRYGGRRHYISTGLEYTPVNVKGQGYRIAEIQQAIAFGRFDEWYAEYKQSKEPVKQETPITPITLSKLWEKHVAHKREIGHNGKPISESTIKRDYGKVSKRLAKLPPNIDYPQKAVEIKAWLLSKGEYSNEVVRRMLVQLNAACKWALSSGLIEENMFADLPKPAKERRSNSDDYKAFSDAEREAILEAFKTNRFCSPSSPVKHSFYLSFVTLAFMTGMRPEELTAITWGDVSEGKIRIDKARPCQTGILGETKTGRTREFPINEQLKEYLRSIKPDSARRDELVVPAYKGGYLDYGNFLARVWKPVVEGLVTEGKVNEYLPVYNMRHTFINKVLAMDVSVATVAYWVGNSPETIMKHYASRDRGAVVPEM